MKIDRLELNSKIGLSLHPEKGTPDTSVCKSRPTTTAAKVVAHVELSTIDSY